MSVLGHKSIQSTMMYIDLENAIYNAPGREEYNVRIAKTAEEACKLAGVRFEYFTEIEGVQLFLKRK